MILVASTDAFCMDAVWTSWIQHLKSDMNYSVIQGNAHVFNLADCSTAIKVFGSCSGNNPAAPYIEINPPVSNGTTNEFIEPCYNLTVEPCQSASTSLINAYTTVGPAQNYVNPYYRLGDQDALVVIVRLPPKAAYFGYQSYVFTRSTQQYISYLPNCKPIGRVNICRWYVLGSVGNSVNNIAIAQQTGGITLPAPGSNDGPEVAFITTSNQTLYEQLKATFSSPAVGGSQSLLFIEPLYPKNQASLTAPDSPNLPYSPHNVITGFDVDGMAPDQAIHDEFNTLIRYAAFENHDASQTWLCAIDQDSGNAAAECKNYPPLPESPITVYRVTKPPSGTDVLYSGMSTLNPRTANQNETGVSKSGRKNPTLVNYSVVAEDLANAIKKYMKAINSADKIGVIQMFHQWNAGPRCITVGIDCYEDTQDTAPYGVLPVGYLNASGGEIAFVVGVNHTAEVVNNATYLSVGIYDGGSGQDKNILILEGISSLTQTNPRVAGFDSCSSPSTDPTKSNCLNGSALQVWRDIGSPMGMHRSLNFSTVSNLYVATVARDTYCASGGAGATLPFCSKLYRNAGYTVLPITPPAGTTNGNCSPSADVKCGKYLPVEDLLGVSERAYVVPGQLNGADPSKIVYPFVVH